MRTRRRACWLLSGWPGTLAIWYAGVGKATTELIAAKSGTVALAAAQADASVQVQRKAAADALAAERAWQLAQAELALAQKHQCGGAGTHRMPSQNAGP